MKNVVIPPAKPGIQNILLSSVGFNLKATNPAIETPIKFAIKIAIG